METEYNENNILRRIFLIRGQRVMLDFQLAELYGIKTKQLNQQVRRNPERFPDDFMFQLNEEEFENLRSQFVTSSFQNDPSLTGFEPTDPEVIRAWGGRRYLPYAFTEHGVMMLSSVLNSPLAIAMNIRIIRVYIKLREMLSTNQELFAKIEYLESKVDRHSEEISMVFAALRELMGMGQQTLRPSIGFHRRDDTS